MKSKLQLIINGAFMNLGVVWDSAGSLDQMNKLGFLNRELSIMQYYSRICDKCYIIGLCDKGITPIMPEDLPENVLLKLIHVNYQNELIRWILYNAHLFFLIRSLNVDILIFQGVNIPLALIAAKIKNIKTITKYQYRWAYQVANINFKKFHFILNPFAEYIETFSLKQSSVVIAQSCYFRDLAVAKGNKDVCVIPLGIDINKFRYNLESSSNIRKKLIIDEHSIIIGFIGRLHRVKNIPLILNAFYEVRRQHNACLVIIGSGPEENNLKILIKKLKLENYVYMLPNVSNEDIPIYLSLFDIFILASLNEGLPKVLIEAMSCGVPPITPDLPGLDVLISDQKNGLIFSGDIQSLVERIVFLIDHPIYRVFLSDNARDTIVRKFSIENIMEKEMSMIKKLIH
ncbi:MAG: glycosyltransferase [Methanothrix sp.]